MARIQLVPRVRREAQVLLYERAGRGLKLERSGVAAAPGRPSLSWSRAQALPSLPLLKAQGKGHPMVSLAYQYSVARGSAPRTRCLRRLVSSTCQAPPPANFQ